MKPPEERPSSRGGSGSGGGGGGGGHPGSPVQRPSSPGGPEPEGCGGPLPTRRPAESQAKWCKPPSSITLPAESYSHPGSMMRLTLAEAYHQSGDLSRARSLFWMAERIAKKRWPRYTVLLSMQGFRYCKFLLSEGEILAWNPRASSDPVQDGFSLGTPPLKKRSLAATKFVRGPL